MVSPAPIRVARRAVILDALLMRSTAESNPKHPRAQDLLALLPQWLDELDVRGEMEPLDAEILATPLGSLTHEQQTDARWSGEAIGVLGWGLQQVPAPADFDPVDPNTVLPALGFHPESMVQGAGDLIARACLRPENELLAYFAKVRIVQCCMQSRGLSAALAPILQQMLRQQLGDLGLEMRDAELSEAQESVARLSDEQCRQLLGNYAVRVHAAGWLVGERERYWGADEEEGDEGTGNEG